MPFPPGDGSVSQPFDFAVLRYRWDSVYGGGDLDTRTMPLNLPGQPWAIVGWAHSTYIGDPANPYLQWGGDNTGSGVEAVLLDFKKMGEDFPEVWQFRINLRAFWYSFRGGGNIELELAMYRGGRMVPQGFDFVNEGGELIETWFASRFVETQRSSDIPGDDVGQVIYDSETLRARLIGPTGFVMLMIDPVDSVSSGGHSTSLRSDAVYPTEIYSDAAMRTLAILSDSIAPHSIYSDSAGRPVAVTPSAIYPLGSASELGDRAAVVRPEAIYPDSVSGSSSGYSVTLRTDSIYVTQTTSTASGNTVSIRTDSIYPQTPTESNSGRAPTFANL